MAEGKREKLKEFYLNIKDCKSCGLFKTKNRFVFGGGNAEAELLFIGEAPGKNEDLQGKPFVGRAGKILDRLLSSIGLSRDEVFIANVLKCRPPSNRDPRVEEVEACRDYLYRQIEIIDPKVICTLGKHSTQLILNTKRGITGLRGNVYRIDNRLVLPINHPAAVLYSPAKYSVLEKDFKKIEELLNPQPQKQQQPQPAAEKNKQTEQLGLF
ncbi:MAG: uracil-DNA glycosylase [Actinomycetota bacterium]|nr:uracil-DNA glycosylase [Actinomycetota bacterium]